MKNQKTTNKTNSKTKLLIICLAFFVFAAILTLGLILILKKSNPNSPPEQFDKYNVEFPSTTKVYQSYKFLGTTTRTLPTVANEGLEEYPVYGTTLTKGERTDAEFTELKQAILNENDYLCAGSSYNIIDQNGYLYLNDQPSLDGGGNHRKLYKHTAANEMYYGSVADDESAVIKQITITPKNTTGNYITGLYAPAGEVVKVEVSQTDLTLSGGFSVYIGQVLSNGQANNIWMAKDFNRMPIISNKINVQKTTVYIGSYFGGPIYIGAPANSNHTFTVTISGAVNYAHFILGQTTKQQFEQSLKSSAPYIDIETGDDTLRFSAPKTCAEGLSYEDIYKAATLWDKIAQVSNKVPSGSADRVGITFLFDPFVAAGAAVAFVGRNTVNCPPSWFSAAINYDQITQSGAWGVIHEYNHHYQRFGISPGDEVTNNAISLVEYALFTNISAARSLDDSTLGSDWNRYTDPSRSLKETVQQSANSATINSLNLYADLLHSFGPDLFIKMAACKKGQGGLDVWYSAVTETSGYNMEHYFTQVLHQPVSNSVIEQYKQQNLPMFVPVASIYQVGRSITYNGEKQYIKTVRPFEIDPSQPYTFNLQQSVIVPNGFSASVKSVSSPRYGTLTNNGEGSYTYSFGSQNTSGEFYATVQITHNDGDFAVQDVELVLCFNQKVNRAITKTTYTFNTLPNFSSVEDIIASNFNGHASIKKEEQTNTMVLAPQINTVTQIEGKVKIQSSGKYIFALGARMFANLQISLDGQNYQTVANIVNQNINTFDKAVENQHCITLNLKTGDFVYFKSTVVANVGNAYINIGMSKIMGEKYNIQTISSAVLYNKDARQSEFECDYFYPREYRVNSLPTDEFVSKVIETNFEPWDQTTVLENVFDGNENTFMHNKQNSFISDQNPFYMVVDLQKEITANRLTLVGRQSNPQTPTSFEFYAGKTLDTLTLISSQTNCELQANNSAIINFNNTTFRYYKLVVTKTNSNRYICLAEVKLEYEFNAIQHSPNSSNFTYYGNWKTSDIHGGFGKVFEVTNGYMEFEFIGEQFAIVSSGKNRLYNFTVFVDNTEVENVIFRSKENFKTVTYISSKLDNKKHKIKIKTNTYFNLEYVCTK